MSFWRRCYASGMLKDGRIVLIGGEQSGAGGDTNKGEIYDSVTDSWSPMPSPPGWATVGDAVCCILPRGDLMIGALSTPLCDIFDPVSNTWKPAASKAIRSNEETRVLLPDDTILTAQCWAPYHSERYSISSNAWKNEGALPVSIVDHVMHEIGPAMLLYNGKVIYLGAADVVGTGRPYCTHHRRCTASDRFKKLSWTQPLRFFSWAILFGKCHKEEIGLGLPY
jgi:hypothetical protein